jgi:hypothetical protein
MKRPRDILVLALRNLHVGEELLCTSRTYTQIAPRIEAFKQTYPTCRFNVLQRDGVKHIKRIR